MTARAFQAVLPPYAHPLDPLGVHLAARMGGKVIAMQLLEPCELLPHLLAAAQAQGYRGSLSGLQSRLAWTMRDAADEWLVVRDRAAWAIRKRVSPMFASWEPQAAIRLAAFAECAAWSDCLVAREVMDLLQEEAGWHLRNARTGRRRHA